MSGPGQASHADAFSAFGVDPWAEDSAPASPQPPSPRGSTCSLFDMLLLLEPREGKHASRIVWAFTGTAGSDNANASPMETMKALKALNLDIATLDQFCQPDADELNGRLYATNAVKAGQSLLGAKKEAAKRMSGRQQQLELQQEQQQQTNLQGFLPSTYYGSVAAAAAAAAAATTGVSGSSSSGAFAIEGQSEFILFALGSGEGGGLGMSLRCCLQDVSAFEQDAHTDAEGGEGESSKRSLAFAARRKCCFVLITRHAVAGPDVAPCAFEQCKQILYTVHGMSLMLTSRGDGSGDIGGAWGGRGRLRDTVESYLSSVQWLKRQTPRFDPQARLAAGAGAGAGAGIANIPVLGGNTSAPLLPLLENLGVKGFLTLLSALLTERRILLVSDHLPKLAQAAYAVRGMLSLRCEGCPTPVLDWHHVFIPVLPASLMAMLDAPLPYIIGLKRYLLNKVDDGEGAYLDPDAVSLIRSDVFRVPCAAYGCLVLFAVPHSFVLLRRMLCATHATA